MKTFGLLLVIAGVAIGAASGARNTPEIMSRQRLEGRGTILDTACKKAMAAYHGEAGKIAQEDVSKRDVCPGDLEKKAARASQKARIKSSHRVLVRESHAELATRRAALIASAKALLEHLRTHTPADLSDEAIRAHEAWLDAYNKAIEPVAVAATLGAPAFGPAARLRRWIGMAGLPFALGLFLVIAGSLVSRRAVHRERRGEGPAPAAGRPPALDFGHVLAHLIAEVEGIARDLESATLIDDDDFTRMQERIDATQIDKVEPLVDARGALEARLGLAGFAAVFSPLSFGERNLNRVWTALVDDHWAEASSASKLALHGFREAGAELAKLTHA